MKLEAKTEKEMREAEVPDIKTPEELMEYIQSCIDAVSAPADANYEDMGDAYGRAVYAMSLAAVAAFHYVAGVEGVSGFQASCADLDVIKRLRRLKGPFGIYDVSEMLYPQYDVIGRITKFVNSDNSKKWLKEEAEKKLLEGSPAHPNVVAHWKKLAAYQPEQEKNDGTQI